MLAARTVDFLAREILGEIPRILRIFGKASRAVVMLNERASIEIVEEKEGRFVLM